MQILRPMVGITLISLALTAGLLSTTTSYSATRHGSSASMPRTLSYNELSRITQTGKISAGLSTKVTRLLNTPFIFRNSHVSPPTPIESDTLGPHIRVTAWNIERGLKLPEVTAAFSSRPSSTASNHNDTLQGSVEASSTEEDNDKDKTKTPEAARDWLSQSQVILLTEVDDGMKRTHYQNVAFTLAKSLHMNAVYGVEFLELGPLSKTAKQYTQTHKGKALPQAAEDLNVSPMHYKGLHGSALLSRFPILGVKMLRLPVCYDWLKGEQARLSQLEKVKRTLSDTLFLETMLTEVRKGGRMALIVDLAIPQLPEKKATFVVTHLENRCKAACREKQISFLLNALKNKHNPVVIGGDFNTSGTDVSPTSVKKEIRMRLTDPSFWTRSAISLLVPFGYAINTGLHTGIYTKNLHDPATPSIPLLLPNPERVFFTTLKNFQFADGTILDLRGDSNHAYKTGFMGNSNQRSLKGFVATFSFERPLLKGIIGTYKLDWFLVKGYLKPGENTKKDDVSDQSSYRFAPAFARTLPEINRGNDGRLSDHAPITVDLPLIVPPSLATKSKE